MPSKVYSNEIICAMVVIKMIAITFFFAILFSLREVSSKIGVTWGLEKSTTFLPSAVVELLLQNQVTEIKICASDDNALKAFSGSGISVSLMIFCFQLVDTLEKAKLYVETKVMHNYPSLHIRYIIIGNYPYGSAWGSSLPMMSVVDALKCLNEDLTYYGVQERTKAVISHAIGDVLHRAVKPSESEFRNDVKEAIVESLSIFNRTKTPFIIEIDPFIYYKLNVGVEFAFVENKTTMIITDTNDLQYTNVFDFMYDSFVWALKKVGYGEMKVVVGEIGWATDGFMNSTLVNAERFWKGLLPKVMSDVGTPMRPGAPIDIYVKSLSDESSSSLPYFSEYVEVYGLNGYPKYKIDLTGQGRDIYPTLAKGITRMPARWCVLNGDYPKLSYGEKKAVDDQMEYACNLSDCSRLIHGDAPCSILTITEKISYAFNLYFQDRFQKEESCSFKGFGKVVLNDPSRDGCVFSIGTVRGKRNTSLSFYQVF